MVSSFTQADIDRIVRRRAAGRPFAEIARDLGRDEADVRAAHAAAHYDGDPRPFWTEARVAAAKDMWVEGWPAIAIAERLVCSQAVVFWILARHGRQWRVSG